MQLQGRTLPGDNEVLICRLMLMRGNWRNHRDSIKEVHLEAKGMMKCIIIMK